MASRSISPGGALLRASRVFSIPPPLPAPVGDMSSTGSFNSDTATLPYPTHLSITTPQSSLLKGDWGLKRPLPLRSTTKSSTPVMRIKKIDTFEHITEFGSASDHTMSLKKWHEMGIPLTTPRKYVESVIDDIQSHRSVFEDEIDYTSSGGANDAAKADTRWKFGGPWLAGQTNGEFNEYMQKEVRRRKDEFQEFLREECGKELKKEARVQQRAALADGESPEPAPETRGDTRSSTTRLVVTDEQLKVYIKSLRQDWTELYAKIRTFLDLPPAPSSENDSATVEHLHQMFNQTQSHSKDKNVSMSPYKQSGPPKTHPSAGLAYSRTASTMYNHPVFGPQATKPPVEARVIKPKGTGPTAMLGVGGFVVDTPKNSYEFSSRGDPRQKGKKPRIPTINVDLSKSGGVKAYVQPQSASIDPKGRVALRIDVADTEAVAVKEGRTAEISLPAPRQSSSVSPSGASRMLVRDDARGSSSGYGLDLGKSDSQFCLMKPPWERGQELHVVIPQQVVVTLCNQFLQF
ncbi:hypothetical protein LSUE1_G006418 [Lachnellula suecica]|uniref:Uncharacterized protein n=1 Tax=Lachnellula suecica TaxID=602035 RepID=A0A8T9BZV6_9HELO|nr:hypothetical protein LSUE1_G006418 [Lachnellula suecica]